VLNRDKIKIDFLSAYWQKQEDFLLLVVEATLSWCYSLKDLDHSWSPSDILGKVSQNQPAFTLLSFLFNFGLQYWSLRQAIRANNTPLVDCYWSYWLPLFIITNKNNYAKVCLQAMCVLQFGGEAVQQVLSQRFLI
jgi:hypothetical protein